MKYSYLKARLRCLAEVRRREKELPELTLEQQIKEKEIILALKDFAERLKNGKTNN